MIKNIIFDFGKVLVDFDPYYMTSQYFDSEDDILKVSEVIFDRLYWDRLDEGTISDEEIISDIKKRLPASLQENAILAFENWYLHLPEIKGMRELVLNLKTQGCKLYLLSNISKQFVQNYEKVENIKSLLDLFDGLVFSGPLGIVKPSAEIFKFLLNKYSLKAEDCLFIDDSAKNTDGAKSVGINAYLFDGDSKKLNEYILNN